jgi:hypothetical protein
MMSNYFEEEFTELSSARFLFANVFSGHLHFILVKTILNFDDSSKLEDSGIILSETYCIDSIATVGVIKLFDERVIWK